MKYLKAFNTHDDYLTYIVGSEFKDLKYDSVSYCIQQNNVHFDKYIPSYNLLDILYVNTNGEKKVDSNILDPNLGYIPIGLCVASTGFFGENEPARWMSLKYMDCTTPDTGSLTENTMLWGNLNTSIKTNDIRNSYKDGGTGYSYGTAYLNVDYNDNSSKNYFISNLFDENNEWNLSILGAVNTYALTTIDGKERTNLMIQSSTSQPTWQTDTTITNNSGNNYAPAACCCWRYNPLGTNQGDWYLGSCGEMSMIVAKKTTINTKLAAINTIYPNDCISLLADNKFYWTSTENNNYNGNNRSAYNINLSQGSISFSTKNYNIYVIAMLQY